MADRSTDVLMYINLTSSGNGIAAESTSVVDSDDMTTDFTAGKFFELKSFSFGVELHDENKKAEGNSSSGSQAKGGSPPVQDTKGSHAQEDGKKNVPFSVFFERGSLTAVPVLLKDITFSRNLDKASSVLWNYFMTKQVISSAAIVKRKTTGDAHPMGFLKFLFQDLLLTEIEWEEDKDALVTEKVTLICRSAQIIYKTQNSDNSLNEAVGPGWGYLTPKGFDLDS